MMDIEPYIKIGFIPIEPTHIVIDPMVRAYCKKTSAQFPVGCPNFSNKETCPPKAPYRPKLTTEFGSFTLAILRFNIEEYAVDFAAEQIIKTINEPCKKCGRKVIAVSDRAAVQCTACDFKKRWTEGWLKNSRYWQSSARIKLADKIELYCTNLIIEGRWLEVLGCGSGFKFLNQVVCSMESAGINVDAICRNIGIELEWPPLKIVHLVALVCIGGKTKR